VTSRLMNEIYFPSGSPVFGRGSGVKHEKKREISGDSGPAVIAVDEVSFVGLGDVLLFTRD
jgi:hypothetical protein